MADISVNDVYKRGAGVKLDELVAVKVMGWRYRDGSLAPPGRRRESAGAPPGAGVPRYSTDIAAAWQVVERLRPHADWFDLNRRKVKRKWACAFLPWFPVVRNREITAGTAPHAICRAALNVVAQIEALRAKPPGEPYRIP
jgi:hypothetical protein